MLGGCCFARAPTVCSTISEYFTRASGRPELPPRGLTTHGAGHFRGLRPLGTPHVIFPQLLPARLLTPRDLTPRSFPSMLAPCGLAPCACCSKGSAPGLPLLCLADRGWTPLCFHHSGCNSVNRGYC
jgi:hypothetical protein